MEIFVPGWNDRQKKCVQPGAYSGEPSLFLQSLSLGFAFVAVLFLCFV